MANQFQVDRSEDFSSKMTIVSDMSSEKYLQQHRKNQEELPTKDIVVNMDGGVGGSWEEVEYIEVEGQKLPTQQLPPDCQEPFIPDFHD